MCSLSLAVAAGNILQQRQGKASQAKGKGKRKGKESINQSLDEMVRPKASSYRTNLQSILLPIDCSVWNAFDICMYAYIIVEFRGSLGRTLTLTFTA